MIVYIYNIGVDLYNGFNGLRHRINWTYFTVLDGLAHPLYSRMHILERKLRYRILRKSIKSLQIKIPERISILFGLIIRSYIQMATSTRSLNITLNYGLMKIIWEAILEWQSIESLVKSCI